MSHAQTIHEVRLALCRVFADVDGWFDRPDEVRAHRPAGGTWSIDQILEHITLTNHYLLLTLRKYVLRAEARVRRGDSIPDGESALTRLDVIGERGSFGWERPEHMEPGGGVSAAEVRATLHRQLGESLVLLERLKDGRGALCRITMTVNDLGKIDLYQWLYFIAQHARRHLEQMEAAEAEWRRSEKHPQ